MQDKAQCLSKRVFAPERAYLTPARSRRGGGKAGLGPEGLMQDKAPCLSKWPSGARRAYPSHNQRRSGAGEVPKRRAAGRKP